MQQIFEIFKGNAKILPLRALFEGTFLPLNLTNCKQITVQLPLAAGGATALSLTSGVVSIGGGSPLLGQVNVAISAVVSALLAGGVAQDIFAQFLLTSGTDILLSTGVVTGTLYCITNLGNTSQTDWEALGLPVGATAAIGVTFIATVTGVGVGTGVVQTLAANSPVTVPFRKCFSVLE